MFASQFVEATICPVFLFRQSCSDLVLQMTFSGMLTSLPYLPANPPVGQAPSPNNQWTPARRNILNSIQTSGLLHGNSSNHKSGKKPTSLLSQRVLPPIWTHPWILRQVSHHQFKLNFLQKLSSPSMLLYESAFLWLSKPGHPLG